MAGAGRVWDTRVAVCTMYIVALARSLSLTHHPPPPTGRPACRTPVEVLTPATHHNNHPPPTTHNPPTPLLVALARLFQYPSHRVHGTTSCPHLLLHPAHLPTPRPRPRPRPPIQSYRLDETGGAVAAEPRRRGKYTGHVRYIDGPDGMRPVPHGTGTFKTTTGYVWTGVWSDGQVCRFLAIVFHLSWLFFLFFFGEGDAGKCCWCC